MNSNRVWDHMLTYAVASCKSMTSSAEPPTAKVAKATTARATDEELPGPNPLDVKTFATELQAEPSAQAREPPAAANPRAKSCTTFDDHSYAK